MSAQNPAAESIAVRPIRAEDYEFVCHELVRHWLSTTIWSRGEAFEADRLPGYVAELGGQPVGQITLALPGNGECEVVTLSSTREDRGVGTALLAAAVSLAREEGCRRIFLTTSNDNLRALGFYQKRGWRLAAVYRDIFDRYRADEPRIPLVGMHGIPLRDEIELEIVLDQSSFSSAAGVGRAFGP